MGQAVTTKSDMEIYDYPGKYNKTSVGNMQAKVMLEAEQALDQQRQANGNAANLFPGGLTTLEKHTRGAKTRNIWWSGPLTASR